MMLASENQKKKSIILRDSAEVNPDNSIFIDDLEENIIGANKVGIKGIRYKNTIELLKELTRLNINHD